MISLIAPKHKIFKFYRYVEHLCTLSVQLYLYYLCSN